MMKGRPVFAVLQRCQDHNINDEHRNHYPLADIEVAEKKLTPSMKLTMATEKPKYGIARA